MTMKTLSPIARPAHLLTLGMALVAISLPNVSRAQEAVDAALARQVEGAKVSLERGLAAAKARGTPISAKFEIEDGKFQLSVYTAKAGHFDEVVVDHQTGKIAKTEEIKEGDDLSAAKSQDEAMTKAKRSLSEALSRALRANKGYHAVSVTPTLESAKPVATIVLVSGTSSKTLTEPLN
jgi:ADP-dependent phosphofructokinase/glucokinase